MVSIPQSKQSSTRTKVENFLDALAGPLLDRCRLDRPALGFAYYEDVQLDHHWRQSLEEWGKLRGLFVEHLLLRELGESPVRRLLNRQRVGEHLFSLEIRPEELPDAALGKSTPVADLNIHRDTFRDEHLCLLFWVPRERARRFLELASNLADYRTSDLDVPPFPEPSEETRPVHPLPQSVAGVRHNLTLPPLGESFVGREEEMKQIHEMLHSSGRSAITDPLALEGLGGIGKTRLALEYAWSHLGDYEFVFFLRGDTPATLRSELSGLSDEAWLALPEGREMNEEARVEAVLRWFQEHDRWLLVLDNADTEESAKFISEKLLPHLRRGHVLLTTRFRRWGGEIKALSLETFSEAEAVHYLITVTEGKRRATPDDPETAVAVAKAVDGLPLALEQIAAWVRVNQKTFTEVLDAITREDGDVLRSYEQSELRYPRSVALTWENANSSLSDSERFLLRFLAWLAPNPVPDFLVHSVQEIWREIDETPADMIALARRLADNSFITARADRSFQLHRLWMELERRRTPREDRQVWNVRVAQALRAVTPGGPDDVRTWPRFSLLEPHVLELFDRMRLRASELPEEICDQKLADNSSILLNQFGLFIFARADYAEAEPLMRRALRIDENSYGSDHPNVARDLNNLAQLLKDTNRLSEAEPLMRRALRINENSYGSDHPNVAICLNNLAGLLQGTNRLSEAEPLMRRALRIDENSYGSDHPNVAICLNNLAGLLKATNRLSEAELLMRRALQIDENSYGSDHPNVAIRLNNLAKLLQATNRLSEAELLMRRHLETFLVFTKRTGHPHPHLNAAIANYHYLLQEMKLSPEEFDHKLAQLGLAKKDSNNE